MAPVVAAGTLLMGLSFPAPALAQVPPSISLTPASGMAGSSFTITWYYFDDCSGPATFTWDGAHIATGSPLSVGAVGAKVPSSASPGSHTVTGSCKGRAFAVSAAFRVAPPRTMTPPPTTTTTRPPVTTTTPPVTTTTPTTTTTTSTTTTTTTTSKPPAVTTTGKTVPADGALTFDHDSVRPGDPLAASGHGCPPGSMVQLTSEGQPVGKATADPHGAFVAPLQFTTVEAGRREVVADCGIKLTGYVDQMVTSSSGGANAGTLLVLVFFVLAGVGVLRWR